MTARPAERADRTGGQEPAEAVPGATGTWPAAGDPTAKDPTAKDAGALDAGDIDPDEDAGLRRRLAVVLAPFAIYAVTRVVQLWLIEWMLPPPAPGVFTAGPTLRDKLLSWDAAWFVRLAAEGYPSDYQYDADGKLLGSALAFFPGYPALIRAGHLVTGADHATVAIAVSWMAGAVLAVLTCALGTAMWNRRVGLVLTTLVCAQPMSVVFSMAYSEPVFLVFVVGGLLAAYRRRWFVAGLLGLAAGLTRPTGAALALAIGVAALTHVSNRDNGPRRWWALAGAALAALGVPAYLAWVAARLGEPSAWFKVQTAGWGTSFDYGVMVVTFIRDALRAGDGWVHVSVAWLLLGAVAAALIAVWQVFQGRIWPPLAVYGLVALVLVVGQAGYYHSKPRLLVPVLLTLVPAALALGRVRPRTAVAVLVGFGFFGLWYGAYLITVWRYAI